MAEFLADSAHWGLALVPVLAMLAVFIWLDAFKLMSLREVLFLLFMGAIAAVVAYPISGQFIDTLPIGFNNYSRYVAPWIEEALKAIVMIGLFRFNRIGYKLDAVISGFAIGAGFSVVENIIYLTIFPDYGAGTWLVRGLGTAVMHGTTVAILAGLAHELGEREMREAASEFEFHLWWFLPGYLIAVAIHTAFNQFPDRPLLAMIGAAIFAPIAIITIFQFGTAEAEKWLTTERAEHRAQVETLRAGKWPNSIAGRRIASARRTGRSGGRQANATLLGAAGVARCRSRRDHAGGGGWRSRVRPVRNSGGTRRAGGAQTSSWQKLIRRNECAPPLQPQRLLGSIGAQAAARPILNLALTTC